MKILERIVYILRGDLSWKSKYEKEVSHLLTNQEPHLRTTIHYRSFFLKTCDNYLLQTSVVINGCYGHHGNLSTAHLQAKDLNTVNIGSTSYYFLSGTRDILFQVTNSSFISRIRSKTEVILSFPLIPTGKVKQTPLTRSNADVLTTYGKMLHIIRKIK